MWAGLRGSRGLLLCHPSGHAPTEAERHCTDARESESYCSRAYGVQKPGGGTALKRERFQAAASTDLRLKIEISQKASVKNKNKEMKTNRTGTVL